MEKVMNISKPKPNPQQLLRDWQRRLRQECRNIDRQIRDIQRDEKSVQKAIKEAAKSNDIGSAKEALRRSRNQEVPLAAEKADFLVNHPDLVKNFWNDLLPVPIQVVDSGVDLYICYGCLSVIDKLVYYSNSDMLLDLLKSTNISRFWAGVFTRKDLHVIMLALNISDTILQKNSDVFMGPFIKEGVLFAIDALAVPEKCSQFMFSMFNDIQSLNSSSKKYAGKEAIQCLCYSFDVNKSSSTSESRNCKLELECVQTLAKHIRTNYFYTNSSTSETGMTPILEKLKSLSSELSLMMTQEEYDRVLHQIMSIQNGGDVISTFEFVESGIADSLVNYLSSGECSRVDAFGRLFLSCTNQPFGYFSLSGCLQTSDMYVAGL